MSRNISISMGIGRSGENLNLGAGRTGGTTNAFDPGGHCLDRQNVTAMDSIKGAIELAERIAQAAVVPTPRPNPHVPESAPPIFHWLGVKPSSAPRSPRTV